MIRVSGPAVRLWAWPAFVATGTAVGLVMAALLAGRVGFPVGSVMLIALAAVVAAIVGAKLYYLALHPGEIRSLMTTGMCIQGAVIASIATLIAGAWILGISVGGLLDVSTPGLLLAMAIGRIGCFLGGCCAGRPSRSRIAIWSSDRHIATRRVPTQLLESALAGTLGLAAVPALALADPRPAGAVFIGALAAYTLGRQLLLPFRVVPRKTVHGRLIIGSVATVALIAALVISVVVRVGG